MIVNKEKKRYAFKTYLLLSILIFGQLILVSLFENNENRFEECSEINIVNSIVKNSNEIYFDFYNENKSYQEIDVYPNLKNINCLSYESNNVIFTSNNFYRFFILIFNLFLVLFFLLFNINSTLGFLILNLSGYFNITKIFFGEFFINYYLLIFLLSIYIYKNLVVKNNSFSFQNFKKTLFLSSYTIILFFDYELFQQLLIYFVLFYFLFLRKNKFENNEELLIKLIPVFYYFLRVVSGIFENLNILWQRLSANTYQSITRYADTNYGFRILNCNATDCVWENTYGPIWEIFAIKLNVEFLTIFIPSITILFVVVLFVYLFENLKVDKFLLQLLFIGPPLVFLLERANFDIYFVSLSLISLLLFDKNRFLTYFILTFCILVKIYPIFLIAGMIIYFYTKDKSKLFFESSILLILNSSILIYYYFAVNFQDRIQDQSGISQSYGLQSHSKNYDEFLNINISLGYIIQILIIFSIIYFLFKTNKQNIFYDRNLIYLSFTSLFLLSSIFGNEDFRIIILYTPLFYLLKEKISLVQVSSIFFIASSPSMFFNGFKNTEQSLIESIYETIPVVVSNLSFLIIFAYFSYEFIYLAILKFKTFKKINN
jgi:hypothetical protein